MQGLILIVLGIIPVIYGFCFSHYGRTDKTVTGRIRPVCEYNGLDILNGSHFYTAGCMSCSCMSGLLECCGFGVHDDNNKINIPAGCTVVADGCEPLVVQMHDHSRDCFSEQPITPSGTVVPIIPDMFPQMFPGGVPEGPLDFPARPGTPSGPNAVNQPMVSETKTSAPIEPIVRTRNTTYWNVNTPAPAPSAYTTQSTASTGNAKANEFVNIAMQALEIHAAQNAINQNNHGIFADHHTTPGPMTTHDPYYDSNVNGFDSQREQNNRNSRDFAGMLLMNDGYGGSWFNRR